MSFSSTLHCEGDGAVDSLGAAAFRKGKQEVHHLPYLSQLRDPLAKLVHVGLVALDGGVACVARRPPESPGGLQQLAGHQVGEVRRPQLRGGCDGEASRLRQPHSPAHEPEGLFGEVQPVHGLVGQQQPLAVLPLLASLLQRLNPQAHHLRQLVVWPEGQLQLRRHGWFALCGGLKGRRQWRDRPLSSNQAPVFFLFFFFFPPATLALRSRWRIVDYVCAVSIKKERPPQVGGEEGGARQQEPVTFATTIQGLPSGNRAQLRHAFVCLSFAFDT